MLLPISYQSSFIIKDALEAKNFKEHIGLNVYDNYKNILEDLQNILLSSFNLCINYSYQEKIITKKNGKFFKNLFKETTSLCQENVSLTTFLESIDYMKLRKNEMLDNLNTLNLNNPS